MVWSYRRATKGLKDKLKINWLPWIYVLFWAGSIVNFMIIVNSMVGAIKDLIGHCDKNIFTLLNPIDCSTNLWLFNALL